MIFVYLKSIASQDFVLLLGIACIIFWGCKQKRYEVPMQKISYPRWFAMLLRNYYPIKIKKLLKNLFLVVVQEL